ncbi:MAG: restriction endonuclease, partial [Ignavibacterium sp.]|nr:restriction endonuclease [Ignavibacterium sp.]
ASRYSLREALQRLGPRGFTFEKLVARIFEEEGYKTHINQILQGKCVTHEIDVLLEKDNKFFTIECKFHNAPGFYTEIKDILYTWARFIDLKEASTDFNLDNVWLISNTKFSEQTKQFAQCRNIHLLGWAYPEERSLQRIIEEKKIYPITVLRTLDKKFEERLIQEGIITCQELLKLESRSFQGKTGLDARKLVILQKEANYILKSSETIKP